MKPDNLFISCIIYSFKIHTDVDSDLTSRFVQPLFGRSLLLYFFSFSAILVQLVR